jgi:hypothetical protein
MVFNESGHMCSSILYCLANLEDAHLRPFTERRLIEKSLRINFIQDQHDTALTLMQGIDVALTLWEIPGFTG